MERIELCLKLKRRKLRTNGRIKEWDEKKWRGKGRKKIKGINEKKKNKKKNKKMHKT